MPIGDSVDHKPSSANELLKIMCPTLTCRRILAVPATSRGKNVRCKNCGRTIRVPAAATPGAGPASKAPDGKAA